MISEQALEKIREFEKRHGVYIKIERPFIFEGKTVQKITSYLHVHTPIIDGNLEAAIADADRYLTQCWHERAGRNPTKDQEAST